MSKKKRQPQPRALPMTQAPTQPTTNESEPERDDEQPRYERPVPPLERPKCSDEQCSEPAFSRYSHGEPGPDAVFLCVEHTVNAVRVSAAQHLLLDIVTHPTP